MPIFALAFGSFGDFATILQLAWQLRAQLNDASGSSAQIRELIADLDIFTRAVQQVRAAVDRRRDTLQPDVLNGIEHALSMCKDVLEAVQSKMLAHHNRVVHAKGVAFWRQLWAVAAWSLLGGNAEVELLRTRLHDHVGLMQTFLALSQSHDQGAMRETLDKQHTTLDRLVGVVQAIHEHFGVDTPTFHFRNRWTGEFYQPCVRTSVEQLDALAHAINGLFNRTAAPSRLAQRLTVGRHESFQETIWIDSHHAFPLDCFFFLSDFGQWQVLIAISPDGFHSWPSSAMDPTTVREDTQRRLGLLLKTKHLTSSSFMTTG